METLTLGEVIKAYRAEHGMSMDDFSKASGISKAYISVLEKNKRPGSGLPVQPSIKCVLQAAEAMDMDFTKLVLAVSGDAAKGGTMKANELFAAEMYRIGDKEHYKGDRKLFVKNLGELLSQTDQQVLSAELDDNEIVTIHFEGGDKKVNVAMDSYTAIIKDVLKVL